MSFDYAIAMPAMIMFQNPLLVGFMASAGYLLSRIYVRGLKGVRATFLFDALNMALSFTLAGMLLRRLGEGLPNDSPIWMLLLALATGAWGLINLAGYLMDRLAVGTPITLEWVGKYLLLLGVWYPISVPFMTLVVMEAQGNNAFHLAIATLPLLIVVWVLRLYSNMEQKNARQEFLRQLDHDGRSVPGKGGVSHGPAQAAARVRPMGQGASSDPARFEHRGPFSDHAGRSARRSSPGPGASPGHAQRIHQRRVTPSQLRSTLHTAFGTGRPEAARHSPRHIPDGLRRPGGGAHRTRGLPKDERQFLELAFAQIAQHVEEETLKKQLLLTNSRLFHQAEHLSQILQICDLLRVHLDVQDLLDRVAKGIRESMGFHTVLISLYHEEEGYFERIAQAGVDDTVGGDPRRPPARRGNPLLLQEKYRGGRLLLHPPLGDTLQPLRRRSRLNPRARTSRTTGTPWHLLIVPLMDKDNRLLGIISVDEPVGRQDALRTRRCAPWRFSPTRRCTPSKARRSTRTSSGEATLDGLTGLYNHAHFQKTLRGADARELADAKEPYTILMMDLDNFKEVNDTYGHLAGDAILRAVAGALTTSIRREDVAARYGGEEFAVFLPERTAEKAEQVAERIRVVFDAIRIQPGISASARPIRVTLCVGIASYPLNGSDHHEVMKAADAALYQAKRNGKKGYLHGASSGP